MKRVELVVGGLLLLLGVFPVGGEEQSSDLRATPGLSFASNGFDFVILSARAQNLDVSIDPAVLVELSAAQIQWPASGLGQGSQQMAASLKPHGFIVQTVNLTNSRRVEFITSEASWAYLNAVAGLQGGDLKRAHQSLKSIESDQSRVGKHGAGLLKALQEVVSRNQQIARLDAEVRRSIQEFKKAASDFETVKLAARGSKGSQAGNSSITEDRYNKAMAEAKRSWEAVDGMLSKMKASNEIIGAQFDAAYSIGYGAEAQWLFENLYTSYVRFRAMLAMMEEAELYEHKGDVMKLPDSVVQLRQALKESSDAARAELVSAVAAADGGNLERAQASFSRAYWLDGSVPLARIGRGYALVRQHVASQTRLLGKVTEAERERRLAVLEQECREKDKRGFLVALAGLKLGKPLERPVTGGPSKIGATCGLAVSDGTGNLFPLSVQIETIPWRTDRKKDKNDGKGYWSSVLLRELEDKDYPVSFGDYGAKDPFMLMAGIEAYKWLRSVEGALRDRVGLKIEFQDLLAGKGGDSAGVTIATSAYSVLRRVPVRSDVAMTGSVRGDGAVKAVGAVPMKVEGAVRSKEVELVIVPRENEGDLLMLPLDLLCRVIIITADDMRTYLKYATEPSATKPSKEQAEALETLRQVQLAQASLLMGNRDNARTILSRLGDAPTEMYTVRRLVEILQGELWLEGKQKELIAWRKEMDEARTQAILASRARDFIIPVTVDVAARASEEESRPPQTGAKHSSVEESAPERGNKPDQGGGAPFRSTASISFGRWIWKVLPFPRNSNWPGPKGQSASVEQGKITLQGQPIRSENLYSFPVTIDLEVMVEERVSSDGFFGIMAHAPGLGDDVEPREGYTLQLIYRNGGRDAFTLLQSTMAVNQRQKTSTLMGEEPIEIKPGVYYKLRLSLSNNQAVVTVNNRQYQPVPIEPPGRMVQFSLQSWQPTAKWHIRRCEINGSGARGQ